MSKTQEVQYICLCRSDSETEQQDSSKLRDYNRIDLEQFHSRVVPLIKKIGGDKSSTATGQCLGRSHSARLLLHNPSVDHSGSHHGCSENHRNSNYLITE